MVLACMARGAGVLTMDGAPIYTMAYCILHHYYYCYHRYHRYYYYYYYYYFSATRAPARPPRTFQHP